MKGGGGGGGNDPEADAKRQKRLAMNHKAAHESRQRKKIRLEELTK